VPPAPTPTPGPATIPLDGTTASGDLDLANSAAHVTGTLPGLPNFAGELLVVAGTAYYRAPNQPKFSTEAATSLPINPADKTSGPTGIVQEVLSTVADKSLNPQLLGTSDEAGGACYHIQVQATPDVVKTGLGMTGQGVGYAKVDLWIYESNFLVERLELHTSDPTAGSAAIRLVLSNYNSVAAILPPAAGQFDPSGVQPAAS
jgi:hypothetical protein